MISATSSLASGILTSTFGTPAPSPVNIPSSATGSTSSQASIVQSLLDNSGSDAYFLSNLTFAQDTESLLQDPRSNGALSGTASSYVQQIIKAIDPGAPASTAAAPATGSSSTPTSTLQTTSDPTSGGLPPEGLLA
jgi:hypothetical protein